MIGQGLLEQFDATCKSRIDCIQPALGELNEKTSDLDFPLPRDWLRFEVRAQIEQLAITDILVLKRLRAAFNGTGLNTEESDFKECRTFLKISHPAHLSFGGLNDHFGPLGSFLPIPDDARHAEELRAAEFYRVRKFLRNIAFTHWHLLNQTNTFSPVFRTLLAKSPSLFSTALDNLSWLTEIFISYARDNAAVVQAIRTKIEKSLNASYVHLWQDTQQLEPGQLGTEGIPLGEDWSNDLKERLQTRDLALLMLSPEFAGSPVIQTVELAALLKRHEPPKKQVWLLPIRLNECKCETLPQTINWFPAGKSYMLQDAVNGLPPDHMLALCESELVSKILNAMADAADAGAPYNFLKRKLQEFRLAGGPTPETPPTRTPSAPESSAPLRR